MQFRLLDNNSVDTITKLDKLITFVIANVPLISVGFPLPIKSNCSCDNT